MSNPFEEFLSQEALLLIKRFLKEPSRVGAIFPSSKALAEKMCRDVDGTASQRILEVGAGTGVFTDEILSRMSPKSFLDIVELDPEFCALLETKIQGKRASLFKGSILDFSPDAKYDLIISSLPLNAFRAEIVEEILTKYENLMSPLGRLVWFEYIGLKELRDLFKTWDRMKPETSEIVMANIPPARVCYSGKDS